jgi:tetratricopeptide (TPR) repeat protein
MAPFASLFGSLKIVAFSRVICAICVLAVLLLAASTIPSRAQQGAEPSKQAPSQPSSSSSSSATPQFFDPPQFNVSGVTDTSSLGGHGSDSVVRTRNSLARETATLEKGADRTTREAAEQERGRINALLLQHPEKPELHHQLADADETLGDNLSAVREYQRAAELDPSEGNLFDWGAELLLHHAPEPAGEVFGRGAHLYPNSSRMLIGLGVASFARGSDLQAIEKICEASNLNPNDSTPYLFLGRIETAETVPFLRVIDALHRFVTLRPEDALANYYYALGLWKRKRAQDMAQVELLLNKALALDPQFGPAYLQLGILHAEQGDYREAISDYQHAIEAEPHKDDQRKGDREMPNAMISNATADPTIEEAHYRLAQAYRRIGEDDKAKSELELYEKTAQESAREADQERHEIRQFVYTLRHQPAAQTQ